MDCLGTSGLDQFVMAVGTQIHSILLGFGDIPLKKKKERNKLKISGNPVSNKSIGPIFPMAFAHFMSLSHILVIPTVSQILKLLLYVLWRSVIGDL